MAITIQEKYQRLREKLMNPVFYAEYRKKCREYQRRYARDPEYRRKQNIANADYKFRKVRGLPIRPRTKIKPTALVIPVTPATPVTPESNFDFKLVPSIQVDFS